MITKKTLLQIIPIVTLFVLGWAVPVSAARAWARASAAPAAVPASLRVQARRAPVSRPAASTVPQ